MRCLPAAWFLRSRWWTRDDREAPGPATSARRAARRPRIRPTRPRQKRAERSVRASVNPQLNLNTRLKQSRTQAAPTGSQPLGKFRADAGGAEHAANFSTLVDPEAVENENVLHGDDLGLHAGDFGNGNDFARAIG